MGETVSLANARIEVEERPGYLLMVEHGTLRTVGEVQQYAAAMEVLAERTGVRRALIDSRQTDTVEPPKDVRDAMWKWLLSARAFEQIAFVLDNEMHVARVNMTALSQRASIKAFAAVHEAHRWLTGRQRSASQTFQAVTAPIITPPRTPMPTPPSTPAPYSTHSSSVPPRTPAPPPMRARPSTAPPPLTAATPPSSELGSASLRRTGEFSLGSLASPPTRRTGQFAAAQPQAPSPSRTPSQQLAAQRRSDRPPPPAPEKRDDDPGADET